MELRGVAVKQENAMKESVVNSLKGFGYPYIKNFEEVLRDKLLKAMSAKLLENAKFDTEDESMHKIIDSFLEKHFN